MRKRGYLNGKGGGTPGPLPYPGSASDGMLVGLNPSRTTGPPLYTYNTSGQVFKNYYTPPGNQVLIDFGFSETEKAAWWSSGYFDPVPGVYDFRGASYTPPVFPAPVQADTRTLEPRLQLRIELLATAWEPSGSVYYTTEAMETFRDDAIFGTYDMQVFPGDSSFIYGPLQGDKLITNPRRWTGGTAGASEALYYGYETLSGVLTGSWNWSPGGYYIRAAATPGGIMAAGQFRSYDLMSRSSWGNFYINSPFFGFVINFTASIPQPIPVCINTQPGKHLTNHRHGQIFPLIRNTDGTYRVKGCFWLLTFEEV